MERDDRLWRLTAVVLLGGIMGILDGTMVAVGIGTLAAEFDTSLGTIAWVSTGYLLALTLTIPVTTWAVDRFGGRGLWLGALGLFLAASLACGLAWDVGSLIVFRVLQGIAAGILDPLVLTLLARAAGPARAGRVMGLMAGVLSLGPVLGPVVGGIVLETLGWRWMFLINLPIGLVALIGALRLIPRDPPRTAVPRLDVLGLALLAPGFAALIHTLAHGSLSWPALIPAALLIGYTVHALRARSTPPLIDLRLFARSGFAAGVIAMGLTGLAMYAILFALPLYHQQEHGALAAGLLLAPFGISSALAAPVAGRLADRSGARGVVRTGALIALLGTLALTQAEGRTWPTLAAIATGLGLGFIGAATMGSLYRSLPGPLVPQGSSVLYMLNQLGASIGIAAVTLIVRTWSFHGVYWLVTAAVLTILAGTSLLPGRPSPAVQKEFAA
ncbi:DHA2 family efflux MFS transporter permease subunit [Actinomadura sp. 9N407]|uniref:DHA2 family efflux MFS transporter permease subunit n=1 Tax=Actinomadura sp. 9N407 TaxID=3375154 RepID=UPI00378F96BA